MIPFLVANRNTQPDCPTNLAGSPTTTLPKTTTQPHYKCCFPPCWSLDIVIKNKCLLDVKI